MPYFAGAGAGVDGVTAAFLLAFLFFFTCFFATGAVVPVAGAAVDCAASDNPAVASVRESPSNTEVIFFIFFIRSFLEAVRFPASITIDADSINPP